MASLVLSWLYGCFCDIWNAARSHRHRHRHRHNRILNAKITPGPGVIFFAWPAGPGRALRYLTPGLDCVTFTAVNVTQSNKGVFNEDNKHSSF